MTKNAIQKTLKKRVPPKIEFLAPQSRFLRLRASMSVDFTSENTSPEPRFSVFFRERRLCQNRAPAVAGTQFSSVGPSKNRPEERLRRAPAPKTAENRTRRRLWEHFFGPGPDFGRFWGPGWEAKFMKNALEEVTAKNAEKKSIGCDRMRWVGVMRWASGRVGRVILRMISLPKGACRIMQDYAKRSARRRTCEGRRI